MGCVPFGPYPIVVVIRAGHKVGLVDVGLVLVGAELMAVKGESALESRTVEPGLSVGAATCPYHTIFRPSKKTRYPLMHLSSYTL